MSKIVLITGCSSGFGYLMALKFARNGDHVYATVRNVKSDGAKKLQSIAKTEEIPLQILELDVTKEDSIKKAVNFIKKEQGRIDILINNAGFGYLGPIEEFQIDEIKELYETNIFGVIRMIKTVVPIMREQKSGLIVNFSSINGIVPFPLFSIYSSTKFAIETLSEGMRFELKHFGIKVVTIEPGSFGTNFANNRKEPKTMRSKTSPYKELVDNFFNRYFKTHRKDDKSITSKSADPQQVADKVFDVSKLENPKLRYLVGGDAFKFYYLRKFLPFSVWEWLLHRTYKW